MTAPKPPSSGTSVKPPPVRCVAHQFEGRYDEFCVGDVSKKVYVQDVCVTCGAAVMRSQPEI